MKRTSGNLAESACATGSVDASSTTSTSNPLKSFLYTESKHLASLSFLFLVGITTETRGLGAAEGI